MEFQQNHPSLLETKTKTPNQQAAASLSQPCMPVTNIGPTKILPYLFLGSMKDALNADLAKVKNSPIIATDSKFYRSRLVWVDPSSHSTIRDHN